MYFTRPAFRLAADTYNRRSESVWGDCPWDHLMWGVKPGFAFFDHFVTIPYTVPTTLANYGNAYKGFTSTGGTINPATNVKNGIITLGSDGDDEAASITQNANPLQLDLLQGKMWFEARVKFSSIADTICDAFFGLVSNITPSATVPITATAGTLADVNLVGFHRLGTDGDKFDCVYKADGVTAVTVLADAVTLVADTWVKIGMKLHPSYENTGTTKLAFYANGQEVATKDIPTADGTDFPNDVLMGLCAAIVNAAAVTSVVSMDWWALAYEDVLT